MSQQNIDLVRRVMLTPPSDELFEMLDPGVRLDLSARVFNPAVYEGYDGIMQWQAEVADVWDSYRLSPAEYFDGEDAVVVVNHERARGRGSGVEVDRNLILLFKLTGGLISEIRLCDDREQAMRDAGLGSRR